MKIGVIKIGEGRKVMMVRRMRVRWGRAGVITLMAVERGERVGRKGDGGDDE